MRPARRLLAAVILTIGTGVPFLPAAEPDFTAHIREEIERLGRDAESAAADRSAMPEALSAAQAALKSSREALQAERPYLALERLVQVIDLLEGIGEAGGKGATVANSLDAFETEWAKTSREVAELAAQIRPAGAGRPPAVIRALSETSLGRSVPLLDGGRGFAISTTPKEGLFYLGEARAQAKFAVFCAGLPAERAKAGWAARSLLPELVALQAKTDAAFQPPRSIDQHPRFIALNSTIKLARELDASRSYHGALYQYLEAVRHYAMLDAPPVEDSRKAALTAEIAAQLARVSAGRRDDSILRLFLERAASQTVHPDGSAPSPDEWRSAQMILSQVAPAYTAAMKDAPRVPQTKARTVEVTLLRWPYT